jgi:hypothetical protein
MGFQGKSFWQLRTFFLRPQDTSTADNGHVAKRWTFHISEEIVNMWFITFASTIHLKMQLSGKLSNRRPTCIVFLALFSEKLDETLQCLIGLFQRFAMTHKSHQPRKMSRQELVWTLSSHGNSRNCWSITGHGNYHIIKSTWELRSSPQHRSAGLQSLGNTVLSPAAPKQTLHSTNQLWNWNI